MRLWIKGYGFSEQNILLRLDKSWLNEYLELDSALDLETWDTVEMIIIISIMLTIRVIMMFQMNRLFSM